MIGSFSIHKDGASFMNMKAIRDFWDRVFSSSVAVPPKSTGSPELDEVIGRYRQQNRSVLDIGCGNGKFLYLFISGKEGVYHGLDLSAEAIRKARALFNGTPLNYVFYEGDVSLTSDTLDSPYDCILLFNILDNLEANKAGKV